MWRDPQAGLSDDARVAVHEVLNRYVASPELAGRLRQLVLEGVAPEEINFFDVTDATLVTIINALDAWDGVTEILQDQRARWEAQSDRRAEAAKRAIGTRRWRASALAALRLSDDVKECPNCSAVLVDGSDIEIVGALDEHELWETVGATLQREAVRAVPLRSMRSSRSKFNADSRKIVDEIEQIFTRYEPPLTVRQVYYQLASSKLGLVELSKKGYSKAQRLLLKVREEGIIPWEHFADRGRERIKPSAWTDLTDFSETVRDAYRKDLWQAQAEHVEFWLEKDALSRFVADALERYGNPLCVVRGFSSATFVHECAEFLKRIDKPKFIYYLGDHDPSGMSIEKSIQERLTEFGAEFHFERLAIGLDDIEMFDLRPLEAKETDSRFKKYVAEHGGASVELDALPPDELRRRIQHAVDQHIDVDAWRRVERAEQAEQASWSIAMDNIAKLPRVA